MLLVLVYMLMLMLVVLMVVLMVVLLVLLVLLKPPSIHHGMFCHGSLSQTMTVGLDWGDVPSWVGPCSSHLLHLHRPGMASKIGGSS